MNKHKIIILLLALFCAGASAQDCRVKSVVVYKSDQTQDVISWNEALGSMFYGKENPQDGDYINGLCSFSGLDIQLDYSCVLTPIGAAAPYNFYGMILSSEHITGEVGYEVLSQSYHPIGALYFADQKQLINRPSPSNERFYIPNCYSGIYGLQLEMGKTYYSRPFYYLDNRMYYGLESENYAPKTKDIVLYHFYPEYISVNDSVFFYYDAAQIVADNPDLFGSSPTDVSSQVVKESIKNVLAAQSEETVQGMVTKTEDCDDGKLYLIDTPSADVVSQAIASIKAEAEQAFYVKATPEAAYFKPSLSGSIGTKSCTVEMMQCDEKWGVPDNEFLVTPASGATTKPTLALSLNHLMSPGRTYDVTLVYAPATEEALNDSCNTYVNIYIADGVGKNMTADTFSDYQTYGSSKNPYEIPPLEITRITMEYTPMRFATCHALQINNTKSMVSSGNRKKYGRILRVIGVEVKLHEDTPDGQ